MWAALAAACSFLLPGLLVTLIGWRGRRLDEHPVCARCRFIPDEQVASDHHLDEVYGLEIDLGEREVEARR